MKKLIVSFLLVWSLTYIGAFASTDSTSSTPKYIYHVRNAFAQIAKEHDFSYIVGDSIEAEFHEAETISPTVTLDAYTSYSFDIGFPNMNTYAMRIYFSMNSSDLSDKSFTLYFNEGYLTPQQIKETILATIYIIDETISAEDAQAQLNQMVITYSGSGHSNLFVTDEYTCFISEGNVDFDGNTQIELHVVDNTRMVIPDAKKSEYTEMSYAELCAPLNALESVCFICQPVTRIESIEESNVAVGLQAEFWLVALDGGNVVLRINFGSTPITLSLDGRYYKVYGSIVRESKYDTATIRVDYVESLVQ